MRRPYFSEEMRKKIGAASSARWQNPEYRKRLIEKQKAMGLRTYKTS